MNTTTRAQSTPLPSQNNILALGVGHIISISSYDGCRPADRLGEGHGTSLHHLSLVSLPLQLDLCEFAAEYTTDLQRSTTIHDDMQRKLQRVYGERQSRRHQRKKKPHMHGPQTTTTVTLVLSTPFLGWSFAFFCFLFIVHMDTKEYAKKATNPSLFVSHTHPFTPQSVSPHRKVVQNQHAAGARELPHTPLWVLSN